jgi:hypothetical protein
MRLNKLIAALLLLSISIGVGPITAHATTNAQRRRHTRRGRPAPKPIGPTLSLAPSQIKVLAEDQRAGVAELFVAVAYNADTYRAIRGLSSVLPEVNADVFKSRAVVAVFLGQRPTAGYGVRIDEVTDGLRISETRPAPGKMVAQVLSSPFKVVSIPVTNSKPLNIQLELGMRLNDKNYSVQ